MRILTEIVLVDQGRKGINSKKQRTHMP